MMIVLWRLWCRVLEMGVLYSGSVANTKYCRVSLNTEYYLTSACVSLRLTNLQAYPTHRSHNPPNILECSRYPILPYTEFDSSPWDRDLVRPTAVDRRWEIICPARPPPIRWSSSGKKSIPGLIFHGSRWLFWQSIGHGTGQKWEFRSNSYSM